MKTKKCSGVCRFCENARHCEKESVLKSLYAIDVVMLLLLVPLLIGYALFEMSVFGTVCKVLLFTIPVFLILNAFILFLGHKAKIAKLLYVYYVLIFVLVLISILLMFFPEIIAESKFGNYIVVNEQNVLWNNRELGSIDVRIEDIKNRASYNNVDIVEKYFEVEIGHLKERRNRVENNLNALYEKEDVSSFEEYLIKYEKKSSI